MGRWLSQRGLPGEAKKILVPATEKMAKSPEIMANLRNMQIIPNCKSPADRKAILTNDYESPWEIAKKMPARK
jgi:tripartite-type tricarboxylate transporter receptor subunit TctC